MTLAGKVAVITGGATGIGRAAALALGRAGADIVVNYSRNIEAAEATVAEVRSLGGRAIPALADVARDAEVRAMMARVADDLGGIDVLVNNAGWTQRVQPHRDLDALTDDVWDRNFAVNIKGPFYCVRAAVPHMERRGGGAVVNVTSQAAFNGTGSSIAYGVSKAGLATLTLALARALAPAIRVNAVAPGLIATGFGGFTETHWEASTKVTPRGRLATVDEVAAAIVYLATADAVTGHSIVVDGGLLALGPRA